MNAVGAPPVLTKRALNRATLARQHLLERADLDPVAAIEAIGGLQAQEPASPYLALWSRLASFQAADLGRTLMAREVVKATLMRSTVHAVSAADYRALHPAVMPMFRGIRRQDRQESPDERALAALVSAAAAFTTEPRSLAEIGQHLLATGIAPGRPADELVWWVRRFAPLIHAPSPDLPWSFGRRPRLVDAAAWFADGSGHVDRSERRAWAATDEAVEHLVRRYLAAFGPATTADFSAWSGLAVSAFRPALADLDARGELWHARDERGRDLLDLPAAPRPDPEVPTPVRLLPMWESTLLAHADRTRMISDADRPMVIARNGDTLATILVDGQVAGLWWADPGPGGRTQIAIEPFRPVDRATHRALEAEAAGMAAFVQPLEPAVYARYRRWRPVP